MKLIVPVFVGVLVMAMTLWAVGMLYFSPLLPERMRAIAAIGFGGLAFLSFVLLPRRGRTRLGFTALFALLVVLYFRIPAANDRDWQPEVGLTPYATINGSLITIHNVRNFDYRTETDFTPHWETRTYDLSKLDSADLIAAYWAGKPIAHIILSFGFGRKDLLAVSIETRKEKGESYSSLAGFFRQYELYYVVADERYVIRVRTIYRQPQEDVYVYRTNAPPKNIRRVFLDYIKRMNELHERPACYNTLTTNCTTSVLFHTRMNPKSPPMSLKVLLSGYVPDYLYDQGKIDTTRPFPELEKLSHVNARAHPPTKTRRSPSASGNGRPNLRRHREDAKIPEEIMKS